MIFNSKINIKIAALLELTRPFNNLILGLSILLAIGLTGHLTFSMPVILAVFSAILIAAGGNVYNDCCDLAADRLNKPRRPIPSGRISPRDARLWAGILFFVGCGAAGMITLANFFIAIMVTASLIAYDYRYKNRPLVGNIIVAFLTACAFLYAGFAVNRITETVVPALFSFFFHLGRELVKDAEDMEGDKTQGALTLPILYGKKTTMIAISVIYTAVIILTWVPFYLGFYSWRYFIVLLIGVDAALLYLLYRMWRDPRTDNLGRIARYLKYDMLIGLLALYLG